MKWKAWFLVCGTVFSCWSATAHADQGGADPFTAFQQRFGGNQAFVCAAPGGKKLSVSVNVPQADEDLMKSVPRQQWGSALSIYLSRAEGKPIDVSWGTPKFDPSMKFMSIRLQNGKTLVFERFRNIPDPDADEQHFDHKPYFDLTIDGGEKLHCSQVFNSP